VHSEKCCQLHGRVSSLSKCLLFGWSQNSQLSRETEVHLFTEAQHWGPCLNTGFFFITYFPFQYYSQICLELTGVSFLKQFNCLITLFINILICLNYPETGISSTDWAQVSRVFPEDGDRI
jgi:hypothetical protein